MEMLVGVNGHAGLGLKAAQLEDVYPRTASPFRALMAVLVGSVTWRLLGIAYVFQFGQKNRG